MRKCRSAYDQIIGMIKEQEAGMPYAKLKRLLADAMPDNAVLQRNKRKKA